MQILDICDYIGQKVGIEYCARVIIPALLPQLVEVDFNKQQFKQYQDTLFKMLN